MIVSTNQTEIRVDGNETILQLLDESNGTIVADTHALYEDGRVFIRATDTDEYERLTVTDDGDSTSSIERDAVSTVIEQANYLIMWPYSDSPFA